MSIDNQIVSLVEEIEAAHEARVTAVSEIVKETHHRLEHFNRKREEMAREQRRSLASNRLALANQVRETRARYSKEGKDIATKMSDLLSTSERERKQEFSHLMEDIRHSVTAIEQDTENILAEFDHRHQEMAAALRTNLDHDTRERSDTTHHLMEDIRHAVATIEQDTKNILAEFDHHHQEMAAALRTNLDHDTRERMASFAQEHEKMTRTVQELAEATRATLADFSSDMEQAHTHWQRFTTTMNARYTGHPKKQKKS